MSGGKFPPQHEAVGVVEREHVQMKAATCSEQRIANLVEQLSRAIARDDVARVVKPSALSPAPDAESQVAATSGQIENKFGTVAAFDPKRRIAAIRRPIEELAAVLDDEVAPLGPLEPEISRSRERPFEIDWIVFITVLTAPRESKSRRRAELKQ